MKLARIQGETVIRVIGMRFYGDPFKNASGWSEDNEIGSLWKRFMRYWEQSPQAVLNRAGDDAWMEIHLETPETDEQGRYEVFVGVAVTELSHIPLECQAKKLPATEYAVFTLKGTEIVSDWNARIKNEWLPSSGHEISHPYCIEFYDQRFKGIDKLEQSELDVYIPVKRVGG